mgnify:CR=1 FL=1
MSVPITPERVAAGQAVYTSRSLKFYDAFVVGFSNRFVWRCPSHELRALYAERASANHLDVGVGTGYYLDRCPFPAGMRLALMDLNPDCLAFAAKRLARLNPRTHRANVLEPIPWDEPCFDSVGTCYLFHCLPGSWPEKGAAFGHLKALLNPGGTLFGATLLGKGTRHNALARRLRALYNAKGIFTNADDDLDGLRAELEQRFEHVDIRTVGCVALFSAKDRS